MSEPTIGDNSQLRSVVERIENVNEQIKDLATDRSDIFKEAKGNGLDIKALLADALEPLRDGRLAAEKTTESLANLTFWATFRRR